MKEAAGGLTTVVPRIDLLATSPLTRAVQTATILSAAYPDATVESVPILTPGSEPNAVIAWLRKHHDLGTVALVGHEPDLSLLVSWLTTQSRSPGISLKKGAACLVEFVGRVGPGKGVIRWLLAPKHLRALGSDGA
jgi:phosphohistidine phosphatase